jgi:hypothetical protein
MQGGFGKGMRAEEDRKTKQDWPRVGQRRVYPPCHSPLRRLVDIAA